MDQQSRESALKSALDRLLAEEGETASEDMYCYAKTVITSFEEIQLLRLKGVRFDKICKLFEESGLLPENANIHSLRQAFAREKARRGLIGSHKAQETKKRVTEIKDLGTQSGKEERKEIRKPVPRTSGIVSIPKKAVENGAGVKPNNTFTIRPIDPEDLPEI